MLDDNLTAHQESLGSLTLVDFDLVSKELILLDKLLLQAGQILLLGQTSRFLSGLLSLGLQELLSFLVKGSEVSDFLFQVSHLLLRIWFLLFDGDLSTPHLLHGHVACGQSLSKLFHNLLQQVLAVVDIHSFLVLRAQEGIL